MPRVLVLDTNYVGKIQKCKVENGILRIKDKEFFVDETKPLRVKSFFSTDDLYICKWDSLVGAEFEVENKDVKKEELEEFLRERGYSEDEIKHLKKIIEETEKKNNIRFTKFEYKSLKPIEPKLIETKKLPELLRQTANIRFIKEMMKYGEKKGFDIGLGKIFIIIFIAIFGLILFLSFMNKK